MPSNLGLERLLASMPKVHELSPEVTRQARRDGRGAFPPPVYLEHAATVTIPGPGGEIPLRVLEPPESRGAYLHFHGGGGTIGGADLQVRTSVSWRRRPG